MAKCSQCGNDLQAGHSICGSCGRQAPPLKKARQVVKAVATDPETAVDLVVEDEESQPWPATDDEKPARRPRGR